MNETGPKTLIEAVRHFSDLAVCQQLLVKQKWPDGKITCPKCGGDKIGVIASRSILQCKAKECRKQFSAKVGTLMEDSPLSLSQWLVAIWAVQHGISSIRLGNAIGTTQGTAWKIKHRIKLAITMSERYNKRSRARVVTS